MRIQEDAVLITAESLGVTHEELRRHARQQRPADTHSPLQHVRGQDIRDLMIERSFSRTFCFSLHLAHAATVHPEFRRTSVAQTVRDVSK